MLEFDLRGIAVRFRGVRQDSPPKMLRIDYEITVDKDEPDSRLDLLHLNLQKYGTIYNILSGAALIVLSAHAAKKYRFRNGLTADLRRCSVWFSP